MRIVVSTLATTLAAAVLFGCSANADGALGGGGSGGSGASSGGSAGTTSSGGSGAAVGSGGSGGISTSSGGQSNGGSGSGTGGAGGSTAVAGPCTAGNLVTCDDFESGAIDTSRWGFIGDPGKVGTIDTANSKSPSHSVSFANIDNRGTFLTPTAGFPAANNRFYVRAYLRLGKPMADIGGHVDFIVGATAPENGIEVRVGASKTFGSGVEMLDVNFIGSGAEQTVFSNGDYTGGNGSSNPGVTLDASRWYCLEALFDGPASEVRVWLDDSEITQLHITDWGVGRTNWAPTYNVGKVGGQNFSGAIGQVSYDDIAFGSQKIGCY